MPIRPGRRQYARLRALLHRRKREARQLRLQRHRVIRVHEQIGRPLRRRCAELHRGGEHRHGVHRRVAGDAAVLVVFKRPVEQVRVVVPVVRIRERHTHELRRAALRAGHERPARGLGVPGLDADRTVIAAQQAVVVHERLPVHGRALCGHDRAECLIFQSRTGELRHVARRGIVPLGVKAVGVLKRAAGHAERARLVVHHARKRRHRARRVTRERDGGIVAGHEHQAVEQLLNRVRLAGAQIHRRALDRRVFRQDLDRFVERAVFEHNERSHDLRRAGNAEPLVRVLFIEHGAGLGMHDNGGPHCPSRRHVRAA